jgi:hypothetical protein
MECDSGLEGSVARSTGDLLQTARRYHLQIIGDQR